MVLPRPYPIVNIVADAPSDAVGAVREAATGRERASNSVSMDADTELSADADLLQRVATLKGLARQMRR